MRDPLSAALAAFLADRGADEIQALRISEGPQSGWTTRIRILVPEAPASARTPPGFLGKEIAAGPDGAGLRALLGSILPEGAGAGARALLAAPGAWLLLDPQAPLLQGLAPSGALPRAETCPHLDSALAGAALSDGRWSDAAEQSAHGRLEAEAAFAQLRGRLPRQGLLPAGGTLHLLVSGRARALLHAPGPRRIQILSLVHAS